jgi:putative ABC transport system permease protein
VVNSAFVRELAGGRRMLGARLNASLIDGPVVVVGIVGDITPAGGPERPALYVPIDQVAIGGGALIVRTAGEPETVMPLLVSRLRAVAPVVPLDRIFRVAEALEGSRAMTRFSAQIAGAFAAVALLLAAIGIYGMTAGDVSARWRELSIRLALGASRSSVIWTILRPCATLLAVSAALGVVGAVGIGPVLHSLLRGVEATDKPTLTVAPLLLSAVGLCSAAAAAWRVASADPAATLRRE